MKDKEKFYDDYFDQPTSAEAKSESPQNSNKKIEYKVPKALNKKKSNSRQEIQEIEEFDELTDEEMLELQNVMTPEFLEQQGYKFIPLDELGQEIITDEKKLDPKEEIEGLENNIKNNPCDYNSIMKLLELYRIEGLTEKLNILREHTYRLFPLPESMWIDWIKDEESKLPKNDFDKLFNFQEFYLKSLSDFSFLKINKRYLKFLIRMTNEIENKNLKEKYQFSYIDLRKKFEEILEFWGLDFNDSSKIWDLYLKNEFSNLKRFESLKNEVEIEKTIGLIRSIYRRRLSFPHVDLDIIWNEYSKWETDEDEKLKIEDKYKKTSERIANFMNLEEKLDDLIQHTKTENNSEVLREFMSNEIDRIAKKNFNYVRLYFEKILQENPDDKDIWNDFIEYRNNKNYKIPNHVLLNILNRACKCCYFKVEFWILLLRELEKQNASNEEIKKKIYEAEISSEDERSKFEIWKYSLEYHCRNFKGDQTILVNIRAEFQKIIASLSQFSSVEYLTRIYTLWAEFESYKTKDKSKLKEIMEVLVKNNEDNTFWKNYINYLKSFGEVKDIRTIYKRAIQFSKGDKQELCQNYISYEKLFGNVEDIEKALQFSKKYMKEKKPKKAANSDPVEEKKIEIVETKQENIHKEDIIMESAEQMETQVPEEKKEKKKKQNNSSKEKINKKDRQKKEITKPEHQVKEKIELFNGNEHEKHTVFFNQIPTDITSDEFQNFVANHIETSDLIEIRIVYDKKGQSKGFAFADFSSESSAISCIDSLNKQIYNDVEILCALSKPHTSGENDSRTIFVNNLPFTIDEYKIRESFEHCGDILDIRIIKDKQTNKPRGYCYVEFKNENSVNEALKLVDFRIEGRKVIIKKSESVVKIREKLKFVVHISNLSYSTTDKDLEKFFVKENGLHSLKTISIVKDENNNSKGFGFAEFENEDDFNIAKQIKGKILQGRPILIKESTRNISIKKKNLVPPSDLEEIKIDKKKKLEDNEKSNVPEEKVNWKNDDFKKLLNK